MMIIKSNNLSGFAFFVLLLLMWQILASILTSPFFPSLVSTLQSIYVDVQNGLLGRDLLVSVISAMTSIVIAITIMIPFGITIGLSNSLYSILTPSINYFRTLPSSAIIPIAIIYLGIDYEMKLFVIVFGCSWPILLNTISGVRNIEPMYIRTSKVLGLSKLKRLVHVIVPASLPSSLTGIRVSLSISLILTITVEMLIGNSGLGYYIIDSERSFNYSRLYGGILVLGLVGVLINTTFSFIEKKMIGWHHEYRYE